VRARIIAASVSLLLGTEGWLAWSSEGAVAQTATQADHTIVVVHVVRNGHPATGRVTIRDDAGHEASCEVNGDGECELSGLASGRHVVEATGPDGTASGARVVMLPDDGKVSLIVQLSPPNAD
jgi:hypothetical protein